MGREVFVGSWSCIECTGEDEFMTEMGVPWIIRQGLWATNSFSSTPTIDIKLEEDDVMYWNVSTCQEWQKPMIRLGPNLPAVLDTPAGNRCDLKAEWVGDDFVVKQTPQPGQGGGTMTMTRSIVDADTIKMCAVANGKVEATCTRIFKRQ
jgi:hypothetical protein